MTKQNIDETQEQSESIFADLLRYDRIIKQYEQQPEQPRCAGCGDTENLTECRAIPTGTYLLCPRCLADEEQQS